jgi:DNA-binding NtrC family response regulator
MTTNQSVVVLSRRPEIYKTVADWKLSDTELFLYDVPSEALAKVSLGEVALLLFDTENYPRYKHVIRKFFSLKGDADLVVLGGEEAATEARRTPGAAAVQTLPVDTDPEELRVVIERLLQMRRIRARSGIVGRSRGVSEMIAMIAQAAPLDVNVLIEGESGTGKELVARALHAHSSRSDGPFISLNCGAMSEGVLESELFGHARGAFTGAVGDHAGVFERADGGTLFLDEVAEMPLGMQTRFLRALETGEFTRVGGRTMQHSDIRLISATHRDLLAEVEAGRFRQDLYYRLRVVVIHMPPLRARKEDIPILAELFVAQENDRHGLAVRGVSRAALERLGQHSWPGNIRELRNVISAATVMKQRGLIEPGDLPTELLQGAAGAPAPYLPVALGTPQTGAIDLALLTSTLLEMRQEIRAIKALLENRAAAAPGPIPYDSGVVETFPSEAGYSPVPGDEPGDLQTAERALIESALLATGGKRRPAAERLGISERTLYRKIKQYGL